MKSSNKQHWLGASQWLIFSFMVLILAGCFMLIMSQANRSPISFVDALFTATSAACVTGLTVVDTGSHFTGLGQAVILVLIQLGGLGIMTFSTLLIWLVTGKTSLLGRDIIQETLTQSPIKYLTSLLKAVFVTTIAIESVGAGILAFRFWQQYPLGRSLYYGLFHSVSAFCNAGFALFPNSMMNYQSDAVMNFTLMTLIISGGIGFVVLYQWQQWILGKRKQAASFISFHARVTSVASGWLIGIGAIVLLIFEYSNILAGLPLGTKLLSALFQSVTSRTAGFNTVDMAHLTNSSLFFIILLMFIGASPGSCGGGIKTSTASVVIAMLWSRLHNRADVNIFKRRVPEEVVSKAITVTFFSILFILLVTIVLSFTEIGTVSQQASRGLFLELLFEVVSAFGTVGLSTGLTSGLTTIGKLIIIVTMFVGRLGPLTIATAIGTRKAINLRYAQEKVLIG